MQSIELIRENLEQSRDRVLARIADMHEHATVQPTSNGGCHTMWILGHLAFIEALVIRVYMLGEPNPLADWEHQFDGDDVHADASLYPPYGQVLEACRQQRKETLKLLASLREEDLDSLSANAPDKTEEMFGTYRKCFQYVSDHWYMHRGQLAVARKAACIGRMWY